MFGFQKRFTNQGFAIAMLTCLASMSSIELANNPKVTPKDSTQVILETAAAEVEVVDDVEQYSYDTRFVTEQLRCGEP